MNLRTIEQRTQYLNKFARPISSPSDILSIFDGLNDSQKRHLANGFRSLFRYYETQGLATKQWLDLLRSNLPRIKIGIDLNVPTEADIAGSLRRLAETKADVRTLALYNLLLDSGLRLIEGMKLFNDLASDSLKLEKQDGFYVAPMGAFRGTKLAYYGLISEYTLQLIRQCDGSLRYKKTMGGITRRYQVTSYKYLRKFAFDTMTSEALNIPESVADFIEGRTPKSIGARHYMQLRRKAIQFYPRYAKYIRSIRRQASGGLTHDLFGNSEVLEIEEGIRAGSDLG